MTDKVKAVRTDGRDDKGRFAAGNKCSVGRPSPHRSFSQALAESGEVLTEGGKARCEELAEILWKRALAGDPWAIKLVYNRVDGHPRQAVDITAIPQYVALDWPEDVDE